MPLSDHLSNNNGIVRSFHKPGKVWFSAPKNSCLPSKNKKTGDNGRLCVSSERFLFSNYCGFGLDAMSRVDRFAVFRLLLDFINKKALSGAFFVAVITGSLQLQRGTARYL